MWNLNDFRKVAIIDENADAVSYPTLHEDTLKLAEKIQIKKQRCLVFSFCTNSVGSVLGYVAFINHRIVPLLLESNLNKELIDALIETYMPDYLWLPKNMCQDFGKDFRQVYSAREFTLVQTPCQNAPELHPQLALLLTTSGSTGSPKLVRLSYNNLKANTWSIVQCLDMRPDDRAITTLPMHYTYGLSIINTHLYIGASVVLTSKSIVQREFWDLLKKCAATNFGGVPYTYESLDRLNFLRMPLPSLRYYTQAGGKMKKDLCLKFAEESRRQGRDFIAMYGASEATARMSCLPRGMAVEKAGSIGIPVPGGRFELLAPDGSLITTPGETGELVYYGDNVSMGYAERSADLARGDDWNGRLQTGDLAEADADGYYYIVGRKSRMIKLFGKRINLMHLEELLERQGYFAACTGEDDALRVFTTEQDIKKVKNFICSLTEINGAALNVYHVDKIPRNEAGKILYSEINNDM